MFDVRFPNTLRRRYKNRVKKNISFYNTNPFFFCIISLSNYKLFISRLRKLNLFFTKSPKRFRRISRKDRFRKNFDEDMVFRRYINKQTIKIFGLGKFLEDFRLTSDIKRVSYVFTNRPRLLLKKRFRINKSFICFDLSKIPFTKKPNCSRMGKGKGAIKAWFIQVRAGYPIIMLKNWKSERAFYVCHLLRSFLPAYNYVCSSGFLLKKRYFNSFNSFY